MGTILAVDDDPDILLVIQSALAASGREVTMVADPERAVSLAESLSPDAVVLDVLMPKLSGYEVLEALRANRRTRRIPVLFLSSLSDPVDRLRGLRSGADDYLPKPIDPQELLLRLEGLVIQNRRAQAALQGSLEVYSLPEVLQFLDAERQTGILSVISGASTGTIELLNGRVVNADFDALQAKEAVVGMIGLESGRFDFESRPEGDLSPAGVGGTLSVQSFLLEAAWLADELSRLEVFVPPADQALALTGNAPPEIPESLEELPFEELLHLFSSHGTMTIDQLVHLGVAASSRLRLVLAWLLKEGALTAAAPPGRADEAAESAAAARSAAVSASSEARKGPFRVLVVDDSAMMRHMLKRLYDGDQELSVVGCAADGSEALSKLRDLRPDVISLDLFMPVLDGVATLKRIMLTQPTPTVIVTAGDPDNLDQAVESSLRFGALGFLAKPSGSRQERRRQEASIVDQVRDAARADLEGARMLASPIRSARIRAKPQECRGIVCVTGGPGAEAVLRRLLAQMSADLPVAVVVALTLPGHFLRAFVSFAQKGSVLPLHRVADGTPLRGGACYLAASEEAVRIGRDDELGPLGGDAVRAVLRVTEREDRAPADELLADAAELYGATACGVVLSGAGAPPERGLRRLRQVGGFTLAQLLTTCAHTEQPRQALERDCIDHETVPSELAQEISLRLRDRLEGAT